jgi:hypothetical protein
VRTLAPSIQIIVRTRYHRLASELTDAGATVVVDEEYQTGRRLAAAVRSVLTDESRRSESDEPAPPTPS